MQNINPIRVALAGVALALIVAASAHAWGFSHENILTFASPVALPGVVLPAGSYTFDIASPTAQDVVVVRNRATRKVLYMGFTNTVTRPRTMAPNAPIVFGESAANQPRPISTWYEIGNITGHQFLYR